MIFSELTGAYYRAVAEILKAAVDHPVTKAELHDIVRTCAFGESILEIEPALTEGRWQLLKKDGTTPITHEPAMPLTLTEKRWLKALSQDPRVKLFGEELPELIGVEPLFRPEDHCVFDRYGDGDPYEDENYIRNFRMVLSALREHHAVTIWYRNRRGNPMRMNLLPEYLEYSEKDDKFRVIGSGCRYADTVNLSRVLLVEPFETKFRVWPSSIPKRDKKQVELEVTDERKALERVLFHFAHFEKQAEKIAPDCYKLTVTYDSDDETEMVIRVLSFGPMVRVTAPEDFVALIKERLMKQKKL